MSVTINARAKELITELRRHSVAQKELWRLVPALALTADGRSGGWSDSYSRAYYHGYWALEAAGSSGGYQAYVDLASGRIVNPYHPTQPAADEALLPLLLRPGDLDAQALVNQLRKIVKAPVDVRYHTDPKAYPKGYAAYVEERAQKVRLELGLAERYVRHKT
jgi:hypothetical protein